MRRVLAVLHHADTASAVLQAALLISRRLPGGVVDVLQLRLAADPTFLPTEEIMTPERQARFAAHTEALSASLRAKFDAWRAQAPAATWRESTGDPAFLVAYASDTADLLVLGRAAHDKPGDGRAAIEAALFTAGATVLLVPPAPPATLGRHIAVAWKPSDTAERAVVAALPLLRAAEQVTVLIGADDGAGIAPPGELVQALAEQRRIAGIHRFADGRRAIGAALVQEAQALGADMLAMGAYAHSRSLEAVFGGATRDILTASDLPVLLHH